MNVATDDDPLLRSSQKNFTYLLPPLRTVSVVVSVLFIVCAFFNLQSIFTPPHHSDTLSHHSVRQQHTPGFGRHLLLDLRHLYLLAGTQIPRWILVSEMIVVGSHAISLSFLTLADLFQNTACSLNKPSAYGGVSLCLYRARPCVCIRCM